MTIGTSSLARICVSIFVLSQVHLVNAQVSTWGTYSESSTGECSSKPCLEGDTLGDVLEQGPVVDTIEDAPATSTVSNTSSFGPDRGAKITTDFELIAPGLVAPVFSGNAKTRHSFVYVQARAQSLMYYTYIGNQPTTLTIRADMSAIATGPYMFNHCCDGALLSINVFTGANALALDAAEQGANLTCLNDCYSADYTTLLEFDEISGNASTQITFEVQPGEGFYLHAKLDMIVIDAGETRIVEAVRFNFSSTELESLVTTDSLDSDGDNVIDALDNCTLVPNPLQVDSNNDGFGNQCDASFSDTRCVVTYIDYVQLTQAIFSTSGDPDYNPDYDFDSNNSINFLDIVAFTPLFLGPPGPSTVLCVKSL